MYLNYRPTLLPVFLIFFNHTSSTFPILPVFLIFSNFIFSKVPIFLISFHFLFPSFHSDLFYPNFVSSTLPLISTLSYRCFRSLIFLTFSTYSLCNVPSVIAYGLSLILPVPYNCSYFISPNYSSFHYFFP